MKMPCPCLIDVRQGLSLTGDDTRLYSLFLKQFQEDDTLSSLAHALQDGQADAAFLVAHSLKGLCAQLGLEALMQESAAMCDILRSGQEDTLSAARERLAPLMRVHEKTVDAIASYIASARE